LIFGATENSSDKVPVYDPVKMTAYEINMAVRDPAHRLNSTCDVLPRRRISVTRRSGTARHAAQPLLDEKSRVCTRRAFVRPPIRTSARRARDHPSAKVFPLETSGRQITMYDPKTEKSR